MLSSVFCLFVFTSLLAVYYYFLTVYLKGFYSTFTAAVSHNTT